MNLNLKLDPPDWLTALHARADQPPRAPRLPLWAGAVPIGSVEADFWSKIGLQPPNHLCSLLLNQEHSERDGWQLNGELTACLAQLAQVMRAAGLTGVWRDEALAVRDPQGRVLGSVERAAAQPLGIATRAVHLVGRHPDGRHWVQRRAQTKANDPGLWDTFMGGMVPVGDTLTRALGRETLEETGLDLGRLHRLAAGGSVRIRQPGPDGGGTAYIIEDIDWFSCVVPEGVVPVNRDGEVDEFRLMPPDELLARMARDEFTLEASLIIWQALQEG